MKYAILILWLLFVMPAFAASQNAPALKVQNEETGPISNETTNDVYQNCLFHIPSRFTPEAREYYCACNSASLQGNFRMNEFRDLQRASNRKPGNKTFEKYVHTAVAPCLDMPVRQIEYLYCLLDTENDPRIGHPMGYCGCVAKKMRNHAKDLAESEIMSKLAEDPNAFQDPVDALWNNQIYLSTKYKSRDDCVGEGF